MCLKIYAFVAIEKGYRLDYKDSLQQIFIVFYQSRSQGAVPNFQLTYLSLSMKNAPIRFFNRLVLIEIDVKLNAPSDETNWKCLQYSCAKLSHDIDDNFDDEKPMIVLLTLIILNIIESI